jgi:hypothetical protein
MTTAMTSSEARLAAQEFSKGIEQFFTQYNLFAWLSAGLIGVPVVNGGIDATLKLVTGGPPILWQVDSFEGYLLVFVLVTMAGLFASALFWTLLSDYVRGEPWRVARWLRQSFELWKKLLWLMIVVIGLVLISLFPLSMVMFTLSAFSAGLASLVPLLFVGVAAWIILVCVFTPHGLALYHMSLSHAVGTSSMVVRANFASTAGLIGIAIAISIGMGLIWDELAADSWLRLIAIAGNAIIGTGLIVASLVFYQNRVTILFESRRWPLPAGS